jgi:hypothetical protein
MTEIQNSKPYDLEKANEIKIIFSSTQEKSKTKQFR